MLVNKFDVALQKANSVARDPYLSKLKPALIEVDEMLDQSPEFIEYKKELNALISNNNFGVDGKLTEQFSQILGEAQFIAICLKKGIAIERVPEDVNKTPDFKMKLELQELFFEIKTPSVINGSHGITLAQESSLNSKIDIETQIAKGKNVVFGVSESQPYANKVKQNNTILGVSNELLEKARRNIKVGQFSNPNTFLVLNLSIIPPLETKVKALRPAYPCDYLFPKAVTGELWMIAFGCEGMLILGNPEFEGKPCVEGTFKKMGILIDPEYESVAGIIFMVHPLGGPTQLYGLYRSKDWINWNDNNQNIAEGLLLLTNNNWNDCGDSNGCKLSEENP